MSPNSTPTDDPFADITDAAVEAAIQAFDDAHLRADGLSNEMADISGMGPLYLAARWQQRLERGDEYAHEVGRAAEKWQAEQDAKRELRRLNYQYKEAIGRGDSDAASKIWHDIHTRREALRAARFDQES